MFVCLWFSFGGGRGFGGEVIFRGLFGWFIFFLNLFGGDFFVLLVWGFFTSSYTYNTKGSKQEHHQEKFLVIPALVIPALPALVIPPQGTLCHALLIYFFCYELINAEKKKNKPPNQKHRKATFGPNLNF